MANRTNCDLKSCAPPAYPTTLADTVHASDDKLKDIALPLESGDAVSCVYQFDAGAPGSAQVDAICKQLRTHGVAVIEIAKPDSALVLHAQQEFDKMGVQLAPEHPAAAKGTQSIGGITKGYGAGCTYAALLALVGPLGQTVRELFERIYGGEACVCSVDGVVLMPDRPCKDTPAKRAPRAAESAEDAFYRATGGKLPLHIDLSKQGNAIEEQMQQHPRLAAFPFAVQGQLVLRSVPPGGSTMVAVPGDYTGDDYKAIVASKFEESERDFRRCESSGYEYFVGSRRPVPVEAKAGQLILFLSRTPHANKIADPGVSLQRAGKFVCWMPACLQPDPDERAATKEEKYQAACLGRTTDHWPFPPSGSVSSAGQKKSASAKKRKAMRTYGGSHYSNGKRTTKVIVSKEQPAGPALWGVELDAAFRAAC